MLNKLKIKITLINLSLMYLIFLLIFVGSHKITDIAVNNREENMMKMVAEREMLPVDRPMDLGPNRLPPNLLILKLDNNNKLIDISRNETLSYQDIQNIVSEITNKKDTKGTLSFDSFSFRYFISNNSNMKVIVLAENSQEVGFFNNLLYSFIVMGLTSGILAFLLSIYFAERTIRPIRESIEKQKTFVADASHELKTPLAVMNSNLEIVLDSEEINKSEYKKWLDNIHYEIGSMSKLINRLLLLTKTEDNKNIVNFENINISKLILEVIKPFDSVAASKGIIIKNKIQTEVIMKCDEVYMKQMINIFIDNAIKYTNVGEVYIGLVRKNDKIELSIKDTGIGIDKKDIEKIFDRFYKAEKSRNRDEGSLGLGLAIANNIIEMHNGKIYVESKKNEGTKFTIIF